MPLLLGPIHIAFIEMIIDPVCSLAFEAESEEGKLMARPPRAPKAPLFSRWLIGWSALQGLVVLLVCAATTLLAWSEGHDAAVVRSVAFLGLVLAITSLILVNRRFGSSLAGLLRPNLPLAIVVGAVAAILTLTQTVPTVAAIFRFAPVDADNLLMTVGAGIAALLSLQALKPLWRDRLLH
jgi:Ca2+-transporting ATPase